MKFDELLGQVSQLPPEKLRKLHKFTASLLGIEDDGAKGSTFDPWPGFVWAAVAKELKRRGKPCRPAASVLGGSKREEIKLGAEAIRAYLQSIMETDDPQKLKLGLPLVAYGGLSQMEKRYPNSSFPLIVHALPDFPEFLDQCFPGITRNRAQFKAVLHHYRAKN